MSDPTRPPGQPSQEEMRAILEQLREVDPGVLVAEAFNMLAQGAQVKLGRFDARVLIDALAGLVRGAEASLPEEIRGQMEQGVTQLQMAQVQAERDAAAQAPGGEETTTADADTAGPAGSPPPGQGQGPAAAGDKRMTDRLWVPGRDPRPPSG